MKERLFRAHFVEGLSITDGETLARLAGEAGLDGREAVAALEGDAFAADVRADEEQAVRLGIRGVPFFVIGGRYGVSGAQPAETLLAALEAWGERSGDRGGGGGRRGGGGGGGGGGAAGPGVGGGGGGRRPRRWGAPRGGWGAPRRGGGGGGPGGPRPPHALGPPIVPRVHGRRW
jgi:hypothetical protein